MILGSAAAALLRYATIHDMVFDISGGREDTRHNCIL